VNHEPLFQPWSNTVLWIAIVCAALGACTAVAAPMIYVRTPYVTREQQAVQQPVKFDHRHHNKDDGVDCFYCHGDARRAPYAGVPATSRCMGCHAQIWPGSNELTLVRASYFDGHPIPWERVSSLPQHVFFDHSIHVTKGIGCVECHGRVDQMAVVYPVASFQMSWCLTCHRDPVSHVRPPDRVTDMTYQAPLEERRKIAAELRVNPPTECSACHR